MNDMVEPVTHGTGAGKLFIYISGGITVSKVTPETLRGRVCHGWAFRTHTTAEKAAIRHYLDTGEVWDAFPYKNLHEAMMRGELG